MFYTKQKSRRISDTNDRLKSRDSTNYELKNKLNKSNTLDNRLSIDRDEFFKQTKFLYDDNDNSDSISKTKPVNNTIFRGLPARSEFNIKQNRFKQNIDINLNLQNNDSNSNIAEFDPTMSRGGLCTVGESTTLTQSLSNDYIVGNLINEQYSKIFKQLLHSIRAPFVFNGFSFVQIFASLYNGSNGNTTIELKDYFNFPHNQVLINGFEKINQIIPLSIGNCILFNDNITFNQEYCKKMSILTKFRKINVKNILSETIQLNKIISTLNPNIKKVISSSTISNLNVLLLIFGIINPTLLLNMYKVEEKVFHSVFHQNIMHRYLTITKQIFGYYQNKSFEILEILTEENVVVGFVKTNFNLEFDCNLLLESINKLKPTLFNVVKIPVFNVKTKLRLKSLLLELNVKTIFMDLNLPELFKSRTCLDDILQNFEFDIGSKIAHKKENSNNGEISSKEFIADSSFIYYVKVPKINLILMMGIY